MVTYFFTDTSQILVVVPYTGDISRLVGEEVAKVFAVMAGSDSTHIVLCVNKCGYELPRAIREELAAEEDPIDFLKARDGRGSACQLALMS